MAYAGSPPPIGRYQLGGPQVQQQHRHADLASPLPDNAPI